MPNMLSSYDYWNGVINCETSSVEEKKVSTISLYPNPITETFMIDYEGEWTGCLNDLTGREIKILSGTGKTSFSRFGIKSGMYIFSLNGQVKKVLLE